MKAPDLSISPKAAWRLIWPQLVLMYSVCIVTTTPVWTAGNIGTDVQAAFGLTSQSSMFLVVVCMAISSGATACISQSMGAKKFQRARRYIAATAGLAFLAGAIMGLVGTAFDDAIISCVKMPERVRPVAKDLWLVFMAGLPFQYLAHATGVVFRSTRQVVAPMLISIATTALHMLLCTGTGLGWLGFPKLGYMGIAWSGFFVFAANSFFNCLVLFKTGYLRPSDFPTLSWLKKGLPYLFRVALPAGAASVVWHSGTLVVFSLVASVPVESIAALAGLTAGLRIESFLFMAGVAFNITASVFVGNCLGAGDVRKAKKVAGFLVLAGCVSMSIIAACMWPLRENLASILSSAEDTRRYIVSYLSYNIASTPFSIASTVFCGVMVGAGATRLNLLIFGGTFWILRIPLGYWLGHVAWQNASGVFCAMLVSQIVQALLMLWAFWKLPWYNSAMRYRKRAPQAK